MFLRSTYKAKQHYSQDKTLKEAEIETLSGILPEEPVILTKSGRPMFVIYPVEGVSRRDIEMILSILERKKNTDGWQDGEPWSEMGRVFN